tara:strand:- start:2928 stop:3239 length:312 start_codon:yes stop_codon:yes gene_type:complete
MSEKNIAQELPPLSLFTNEQLRVISKKELVDRILIETKNARHKLEISRILKYIDKVNHVRKFFSNNEIANFKTVYSDYSSETFSYLESELLLFLSDHYCKIDE